MVSIRRILVPTDFSDCSRRALGQAVKLAHRHRAELHLLHVIVLEEVELDDGVYPFSHTTGVGKQIKELARPYVEAPARVCGIADIIVSVVHRSEPSAAPPILEYVQKAEIDMIVLGIPKRRAFPKMALRGVSREVIRFAPCPVWTTPARPGLSLSNGLSRILVPVDLHDPGKAALETASELAVVNNSKLQVLYVSGHLRHQVFYDIGPMKPRKVQPDTLPGALSRIRELLDELEGAKGTPIDCHALEGNPAHQILRFSRDHRTDLIVLPAHGGANRKGSLLGRTSEKVTVGADCPVLLLKAARGGFRLER